MKICKHNDGLGRCGISGEYCVEGPCHCEEFIEYEPVRHGRWDDTGRYTFTDGSLAIRCTECGAALHLNEWEKYNWNYCPNCGCKMDGESDE